MLSSPRKPPLKTLLPSASSRLSHHVKFTSSFWKTRSRNARSRLPSITNTRSAAITWTGGLTSSKFHSYAGSAPLGCRNHSRRRTTTWYFANAGSRCAHATAWKPESQAANHGYSHGSGIARMSNESRWRQRAVAAVTVCLGRRRLARISVEPAAHVVRVDLLAPDEAGAGLAQYPHLFRRRARRRERAVELVRIRLPSVHDRVEGVAVPVAGARPARGSRAMKSQPHLCPATCRHGEPVVQRRLRPVPGRVDGRRSGR